MIRTLAVLCQVSIAVAVACACSDPNGPPDAGDDAGALDAGRDSGGAPIDADLDDASLEDAGEAMTCVPFATCEELGATCNAGGWRCTCALGSGLYLRCDLEACPETIADGDPCDPSGPLSCGGGFEDAGYRCVVPEDEWVRCARLGWDGVGPRQWCPPEPPAEGDPCCVVAVSPAPPPDECPYPDGSEYRCVDDHWARSCSAGATSFPPPAPLPSDVTHTSWTVRGCIDGDLCGCTGDMGALARCEPIELGMWTPLGSVAFRVRGVEAARCITDVGRETEGGVTHYRCSRPLDDPLCCLSIPLVESECTLVGSCNVLPGAPDPCPTDGSGPPLCTTGASCE